MNPKSTKPRIHSSRSYLGALLLSLIIGATNISQAQVPVFSNIWNIVSGTNALGGLPNDLPSSGNAVRGIAINPLTTNVLFASSTAQTNGGIAHITVLDYTNNGNYIGQLSGTNTSSGSVAIAPVKVADDGNIYACNVSAAPASTLRVYRWPADNDFTTNPAVVFASTPGASFQYRVGDYMDVRGSGIDTEIVITGTTTSGANISTNFLILKPTDATLATFTNISISFPGNIARGSAGIAFEGTNNAIYAKLSGSQQTARIAYDPTNLTSTVTATFNLDQSSTAGIDYAEVGGTKLLSGVCFSTTAITNGIQHFAKVFQLTSASNYSIVLNKALPLPNQANGNSLAMSDFRKGFAVFSEPNNGIALHQITGFVTNTPPSLPILSGGGIYVEGYSPLNLSVTASGSTPLSYQWYFNTNTLVVGGTSNILSLGAADLSEAGTYDVVITNLYGSITSGVTTVTVLAGGYSKIATQIWTLAPGSRDYVTTTDTQRGMAYDAVSKRLVLVSRAPTNGIHLLDAATGADLGDMDQTFSASGTGTFAVNMAAVADDGVVYVCNLSSATDTSTFYIYRWDGASNSVEGVTQGAAFFNTLPVGGRLGDTLAARGAGVNTEIIASFNLGTNIALFTTADGVNFSFNLIAVTNLPVDAQANGFARLGLAFGSGNTFWAKSSGFQLRQVRYDLAAGTGEVIATAPNPPNSVGPIGVDAQNGILAGIGFGQTPQNVSLYDLEASGQPALIDRENFPANNANANGTGAATFDVAGGRLFALDSNSGIVALNYAPRLFIAPHVTGGIVTWTGPGTLQASTNVSGTYTNVTGATSPYTNAANSALFFRVVR